MSKLYGGFHLHEKVEVISGRLKGETVCVVGETNLNMDYRIIVNRSNRQIGIPPHQLRSRYEGTLSSSHI